MSWCIALLLSVSCASALQPSTPPSYLLRASPAALVRTSRGPARPPALCAASAPVPRPSSLLASNSFRVVAATLLITLDITFYTFPLPFLGGYLSDTLGCSPSKIANLVATFTYSALAAGAAVVFLEGRRDAPRTQRQQCARLATAAFVMASVAGAQAVSPTFRVLFLARLVQGAASQFAWAIALAAAASLGPFAGVKATAWVMAGNSLGEVLGPQFGSKLYGIGGVRLPFAAASGLAFLLAGALAASAATLRPAPSSPSTDAAAASPR